MDNDFNKENRTMFEFPDTNWDNAFENENFLKVFSSDILEEYIIKKRWYGGKASTLKYIEIIDFFKLKSAKNTYYGALIEVNFKEAFFQHYFMPIAFMVKEDLDTKTIIASVTIGSVQGYLVDALHQEDFRKTIFENIISNRSKKGSKLLFHHGSFIEDEKYENSRFMGLEQSNTSIIFNEKHVLKIFRRIYPAVNPDYEISRFLTERMHFPNSPAYSGSINMQGPEGMITLGLMQELVENQGDAWNFTLGKIDKIFKTIHKKKIDITSIPDIAMFKRLSLEQLPASIIDWLGLDYIKSIQKMALRTAEMHVALGSDIHETAFTPTTYNGDYSVWLKNRLLYQFQNRLNIIENRMYELRGMSLDLAHKFLDNKKLVRKRFVDFDWTKMKSERIRIHGDYHLGQILVNGDDFYILDFEGEPESTIRDRKVKQPPLKDVAGLFRSFHYAIYATIFNNPGKYKLEQDALFAYGELLYKYIVSIFLEVYVEKVQSENLNIGYNQEIEFLLKYCLLEKAVYELGYELNSRPSWAVIPLSGIESIMEY